MADERTVPYVIDVPEQGIKRQEFDEAGAKAWIEGERQFYASFQELAQNQQLQLGNVPIMMHDLRVASDRKYTAITNRLNAEWKHLVDAAKRYEVVLSQGILATHARSLQTGNRPIDLKWFMFVHSSYFLPENDRNTPSAFRASLGVAFAPLVGDKKKLEDTSRAADELVARAEKRLADTKEHQEASLRSLNTLEEAYRTKIATHSAVKLWKNESAEHNGKWPFWLWAFILMIIIPLAALIIIAFSTDWFPRLIKTLNEGAERSAVNLGSIVVIVVPVVFYAWLLRSVNRMFLHSLNAAHDATHRAVMTETFISLTSEEKLKITDADRAIILNALYRPALGQGVDEGPPTGLIDMIKPKSGNP